jgi:hypothetical protein
MTATSGVAPMVSSLDIQIDAAVVEIARHAVLR